jgi:hypothetical protein
MHDPKGKETAFNKSKIYIIPPPASIHPKISIDHTEF